MKEVGSDAIVGIISPDVNYPSAQLMEALRQLELRVCLGTMSTVKDMMSQDVVIRVPDGTSTTEDALKTALYEGSLNLTSCLYSSSTK